MTTDPTTFQVGDVIRRVMGDGSIRTRTVEALPETSYGEWRVSLPHEGATAGLVASLTRSNMSEYALVSRPGAPREEVKAMSKFNTGDIIRYNDDANVVRAVVSVDNDRHQYTVTSETLRNLTDTDIGWTDGQSYFDERYTLVYRPATSDDAHRADMATLSRKLAAEARARGWCSEYITVIERFNEDLTIPLEAYPSITVLTTATLTVVMTRTDEVTDGMSASDYAHDRAYEPNRVNITPPEGWEIISAQTTAHSGTEV